VEHFLHAVYNADGALMLDVLDAALVEQIYPVKNTPYNSRGNGSKQAPNQAADLDALLRDGGSAYRVNDTATGLERRVDGTITELARQAAQATASGRHLKAAWRAAYGIRPDPTAAYAEAVKAIEAALIPLVVPDKPKATLGRVLQMWEKTANQWELAIFDEHAAPAEITPLVSLASLVWKGQRDRHAGTPTAIDATPEAAEMAVHAAGMIVYWVSRGGLRQK
jgi:hypothetical protein